MKLSLIVETAASGRGNPFSTRRVRPGALAYVFPPGLRAEQLVCRLQRSGWWGEILGPHGSGKSTLVYSLIPLLERAGRRVRLFRVSCGQRTLPFGAREPDHWDGQTQVVVDGFESLNRWTRAKLKRICRRRQAGLLVTAHQSAGLPCVARTSVSLEMARRVVSQLLPPAVIISDEEIARSYRRHRGNMREVLFGLYDVYERGRYKPHSE